MSNDQPPDTPTAEWLARFEADLVAVGFSERRVDALLCVALSRVLDDLPLTLADGE